VYIYIVETFLISSEDLRGDAIAAAAAAIRRLSINSLPALSPHFRTLFYVLLFYVLILSERPLSRLLRSKPCTMARWREMARWRDGENMAICVRSASINDRE